jgi:hypothetical protein
VIAVPGPPFTITCEMGVVDAQCPPSASACEIVTTALLPAGFSKT